MRGVPALPAASSAGDAFSMGVADWSGTVGDASSIHVTDSSPLPSELASLHDKLRELQLVVSRLHRQLHEREEEHNKLSLLLSRRMTILSNILLTLWTFFARAVACFRERARVGGALGLVVPTQVRQSNALGALLLEAALCGVQNSAPFALASWFLSRRQGWKRNWGFGISTVYSMYLAVADNYLPWMNYISIFFNITYLVCRYYFLHGLLSFHDWASFIH